MRVDVHTLTIMLREHHETENGVQMMAHSLSGFSVRWELFSLIQPTTS